MLKLMELCVVAHLLMERLIVVTRRALLHHTIGFLPGEAPLPLDAMVAIAHQCFISEYVQDSQANGSPTQ